MLFQGTFWLANNYSETIECVQKFLQSEDSRTMVVIDSKSANDIHSIIDYIRTKNLICWKNNSVIVKTSINTTIYEPLAKENKGSKTIYIFTTITSEAVKVINETCAFIALFTSL
jgi:hypothetical protein